MNIFYLDDDIDTCCKYHVDAHAQKIPLEMAQMLTTNMWLEDCFQEPIGRVTKEQRDHFKEWMKPFREAENKKWHYWPIMTQLNHPCTIWLRESFENFAWGVCYANQLDWERYVRFLSKPHKSVVIINELPNQKHFVTTGWTTPALAVMDAARYEGDPIRTYREYYVTHKSHLHQWTLRNIPDWIKNA